MSNIEKYNDIFKKLFNVSDDELGSLAYKETAEWNSMAQIALVAEIEEQFDLDLIQMIYSFEFIHYRQRYVDEKV